MLDKSQENNSQNQNGDYDKDINFLPEEVQPKPGKNLSSNFSSQAAPTSKMKKPAKIPSAGREGWFKKITNLFKPRSAKPKSVVKDDKKEKNPPQFMHSKKPNLQVDVKLKPASSVSSDNKKPQPLTSASEEKEKSPQIPKTKNKEKPAGQIDLNKKKQTPPPKPQPDKHVSFSSLKELVENEPEPKTEEFDVNLIPAELITADIKRNFIKKFIFAGIGSILIVAVFYTGASILGAKRQKDIGLVKQEVDKLNSELKQAQDTLNRLSDFTKQAGLVSEVLKGQKKWSQLFTLLEKETIPEVYYTSVSISPNDEVGLNLVAKSYHDLARQYIIFKSNPNIKEMSMGSASMDTEIWDEYLKELQLAAEKDKLDKEGEVSSFKMPTYSQVQNLITVDSNFKFIYKFSQEQENK